MFVTMYMVILFLLRMSISRPPLHKHDGVWVYQVNEVHDPNFSDLKIPRGVPFLGMLNNGELEDLFSLVGVPYDSLPLGLYVFEAFTPSGSQLVLHPETGDRYEMKKPSGYQVGQYLPGYKPHQYLELQSLGYTYKTGSLDLEVDAEHSELVEEALDQELKTEFTHHLVLDTDGKYHISWVLSEQGIVFKLEVETLGYIGLGFSPSGGMNGADIVIAWVDDDDGEVHLTDRIGLGNFVPPLDRSNEQNLILQLGFQNETHTVVQFYRDLDTCDKDDVKLGPDTVRLIWSYHQNDMLRYHSASQRGVMSVYLMEPIVETTPLEEHKVWEVTAGNVTIPHDDHTHYFCRIIKLPEDASSHKHHIIAVNPLIQSGNEAFVHHIGLSECVVPPYVGSTESLFERHVDQPGAECWSPGMPPEFVFCRSIIAGWGPGSPGYKNADHVGIPMGEQFGGGTYFRFEIHYDNPALHKEVVDNSGLKIAYTDQLREMDMGFLVSGVSINFMHMIPPNQELFLSAGYCTAECTKQVIPEGGVKVYQVWHHMHQSGKKIRTRHVRNGVELPLLTQDNNYDFNFQSLRVPDNDVVILPGDIIFTECEYNSKDTTIHGGLATKDEMCLTFLSYYPKSQLSDCVSGPTFSTLLKSLGIEKLVGGSYLENFINYTYHTNPALYNRDSKRIDVVNDLAGFLNLDRVITDHLLDEKFFEDFSLQADIMMQILMKMEVEAPPRLKGYSVESVFKTTNWRVNGPKASQIVSRGEHSPRCAGPNRVPLIGYKPYVVPSFTELSTEEYCM